MREWKGRSLSFNDYFSFQWHITDRCSLQCLHCYREEPKPDLGIEELLSIFEKFLIFLKEKNLKGRIHFAGGEPLLSPHIFVLLKKSFDSGIPSRILTSGTVIDKNRAEKIFASGGRFVQISLEGSEGIHDRIRGKGSFQKAIKGAEALKNAGVEVTFAATLWKENLQALDYLPEVGKGIARRLYFSRLVPRGRGMELACSGSTPDKPAPGADPAKGRCVRGTGSASALLSSREWQEAMKKILKIKEFDVPLRDPTWRPFFLAPVNALRAPAIAGCSIGFNSIAVESNGDAYLCRRLPLVIGNLLNDDFLALWNHPFLEIIRDRENLKGRCGKCAYKWLCGGCRGIAFALKGDYLEEDPQCPWDCKGIFKGCHQ